MRFKLKAASLKISRAAVCFTGLTAFHIPQSWHVQVNFASDFAAGRKVVQLGIHRKHSSKVL